MENPNNIRHFCAEHAPKPDAKHASLELDSFLGKFVKLGFPIPGDHGPTHEHMWVDVTGLGGELELRGTLANDPIYIEDLVYGDTIEFNRDEVEDMLSEEDIS